MSTAPVRVAPASAEAESSLPLRVLGALLCLVIVYFHIKDQNGFPGDKADDSATYIQIGYYIVEAVGVVAALLLLTRAVRPGWLLALGVATGPMLGYVLSRSTGLPGYSGDKGNWFGDAGHPFTQFVDTASFVVEIVLLLLAAAMLARVLAHRSRPAGR